MLLLSADKTSDSSQLRANEETLYHRSWLSHVLNFDGPAPLVEHQLLWCLPILIFQSNMLTLCCISILLFSFSVRCRLCALLCVVSMVRYWWRCVSIITQNQLSVNQRFQPRGRLSRASALKQTDLKTWCGMGWYSGQRRNSEIQTGFGCTWMGFGLCWPVLLTSWNSLRQWAMKYHHFPKLHPQEPMWKLEAMQA